MRGLGFNNIPLLRIEELKKIICLERELRLSDKYQEMYSQSDENSVLFEVTDQLQKEAARNSGVEEEDLEEALSELRSCRFNLGADSEFMNFMNEMAIYVRFDRSRRCPLELGQLIPDVPLFPLSISSCCQAEEGVMLKSHLQPNSGRPLVIMAGSGT